MCLRLCRASVARAIHRRIQVGTDGPIFGLDDILLPPEERQTNLKEPAADAADREHKYKTEHMQIYDQAGMEWPPKQEQLPTMAHLGQRTFEAGALLLLFCTRRVFPQCALSVGIIQADEVISRQAELAQQGRN